MPNYAIVRRDVSDIYTTYQTRTHAVTAFQRDLAQNSQLDWMQKQMLGVENARQKDTYDTIR